VSTSSEKIDAFPLAWPVGWPRSRERRRATFGTANRDPARSYVMKNRLSISGALDRLLAELDRLGAKSVVISTNVPVRLDGLPYSKAAEPADPGAAVYFRLKEEPRALACDKWDRLADNLAALAKHIEAIRGQVRWGVGSLERAFGGYLALTAVGAKQPWWEILALRETATLAEVEAKRIELLQRHHPDKGGSHTRAAEINAAADDARRELAA
jgi:hypothetical protein